MPSSASDPRRRARARPPSPPPREAGRDEKLVEDGGRSVEFEGDVEGEQGVSDDGVLAAEEEQASIRRVREDFPQHRAFTGFVPRETEVGVEFPDHRQGGVEIPRAGGVERERGRVGLRHGAGVRGWAGGYWASGMLTPGERELGLTARPPSLAAMVLTKVLTIRRA